MNRNILLHLRLSIIFSILVIFVMKIVLIMYPTIGYGMLLVSPPLIIAFQILYYYLTSSNFLLSFINFSLNYLLWIQQISIITGIFKKAIHSALGQYDYICFFLLYGLIFALNKILIEKTINSIRR